jgi:hypothetical protein
MESEVRKLEGYPIKLRAKHLEMETGCYRALPDHEHIIELWEKLLPKPEALRVKDRKKTRAAFEKNYGWDKTAKIWEECIDELDYGTWDMPTQFARPDAEIPQTENNNQQLQH